MGKKLVRDELATFLNVEKCNEDERLILLAKKLCEEAVEFLTSLKAEELADVLEVIVTLLKFDEFKDVPRLMLKKRRERGSFDECYTIQTDIAPFDV